MADKKISQLASGTNAQAGDLFVIARSGANYSLTTAELFNAPSATATFAALTVDTNTLFVDAANNLVGIGTASPVGSGSSLNISVASGASQLIFSDTGVATDQKHWTWQTGISVGAGVFRLRALNDALSDGRNAYILTRSGIEIQTHQWFTANTERMRLDAAGHLGLNRVPSAWSGSWKAIQVNNVTSVFGGSDNGFFGVNVFNDGANKYIGTGFATLYGQTASGQHHWYIAPSGTTGATISFTQAMTLDASGNLGIGVTSPTEALSVRRDGGGIFAVRVRNASNATSARAAILFQNDVGETGFIGAHSSTAGTGIGFPDRMVLQSQTANGIHFVAANASGAIQFNTGGTASVNLRWWISNSGHLLAGADNSYDIGASGATRPRDVFIGGTFTGSKVSVSGVQDAINAVFTQNGESALINLRNATGGTAATAAVFLGTDASTATLAIRAYSSVFTTSGLAIADSVRLSANRPGGLTLQAADAAGVIRMAAGGTTERVRVKAEGQVRFVPLAAAPTTSVEDGDVYYDSGTNKLRVRAGGAWVDLH